MKALLIAATLASLAVGPALADDSVASVPGDDIFGYTSATDVGNPGDKQIFNENDGRVAKRQAGYFALDSKIAVDNTFAADWWGSVGLFTNLNSLSGVPGLGNLHEFDFDGGVLELEHRVIQRSAGNPFAVSLDVETDFNLHDPETGLPAETLAVIFKAFVDAPIRPDTFYWAANLQYAIATQQAPGSGPWSPASLLLVSTAATWQASPQWFLGAEARYFVIGSSAWAGNLVGQALYVGPTLLWKPNETYAFNVTYQPQVWGRAAAAPTGTLDLSDFERSTFRLKAVISF